MVDPQFNAKALTIRLAEWLRALERDQIVETGRWDGARLGVHPVTTAMAATGVMIASSVTGPPRSCLIDLDRFRTADRTRDLIPAVVRVFTFLHPDIAVGDVAGRTMVRLELGLPASLADLGVALGASLTRAQYLSLAGRGLTTPEQFAAADAAALVDGLGLTKSRVVDLQDLLQRRLRRQQENVLAPLLPAPTE